MSDYRVALEFLKANPNATTGEVIAATGVKNKQKVYAARNILRKKGIPVARFAEDTSSSRTPKIVKRVSEEVESKSRAVVYPYTAVNLTIELPEDGAVLKLTVHKRVVGTLYVTENGIRFVPSNSKRIPERHLSYRIIQSLQEHGI
jgi:hypothetical protein